MNLGCLRSRGTCEQRYSQAGGILVPLAPRVLPGKASVEEAGPDWMGFEYHGSSLGVTQKRKGKRKERWPSSGVLE